MSNILKDEDTPKRTYEGLIAVLLLSLALIGSGFLLWYFPRLQFYHFCQAIGAALLLFGIVNYQI